MAFKHPHRKLDPSVLNPEFPSNDSSQKSTTRRKQLHHLMPESISGKQQKRSARTSRSDRSRSTRFSSTKVKFNLRFFVISLAVSLMAAAGLHAWHSLCVKRQANYYLTHADHLEADGKMRAAARALVNYNRLVPDNVTARIRLANVFDKSVITVHDKYQVINYYRHALGLAPNHTALMRRLATLLIEV